MFFGKTLNSHSASLHPGVSMGTSELLGKPDKLRGSDLRWTSIPSRGGGGVEILLAASCYGNWDKLREHEPVLASRLHFSARMHRGRLF